MYVVYMTLYSESAAVSTGVGSIRAPVIEWIESSIGMLTGFGEGISYSVSPGHRM